MRQRLVWKRGRVALQGKWKFFWLGLLVLGIWVLYQLFGSQPQRREGPGQMRAPVRCAVALAQDVPHFLNGLGTVLPSSDVLVKSRVSGQLMKLHFREGEHVMAGDLLAEIDPRPFQAALDEARGKLAADEAQLANARRDLARYASLVKGDFVERQKYDTQKALVAQYEGACAADRAACENARLQLEYSRITAPASGIVGLRKVDCGNQISSSDSEGLVRICEVSPCDVLFSLPETAVPKIARTFAQARERQVSVQAWDREQKTLLATGYLLSLDNEIDKSTGTVRLKARFANQDKSLYPNQFVNARLCVDVLKAAVTVPASAVQIGSRGTYVYVLEDDQEQPKGPEKPSRPAPAAKGPSGQAPAAKGACGKVSVRLVSVGLETARFAVISQGLKNGEQVIVDGVDRLRDGALVRVSETVESPRAEPF
ncbi:MAG: MdtA/MuxA family multidrug efflux RND transporter periplasmic adaptor subunit [Desulfovibrio sp.]|nr:MdtA/MuxA family multidrug efflux RND transporter periplasmic adaptor subunit [Desulfovibrio sp.]